MKRIKTSFYSQIPRDVFVFLHFARGIFELSEIAKKMLLLFRNEKGYENTENALLTIKKIYRACRQYDLCV